VREVIAGRLKGSIDVVSKLGVGTTFTLKLPLTLAVIQVLLLRAAGEVFAVPLDVVARTFTCSPAEIHVVYQREVLTVQGRQVPLVRLRDVLELEVEEDRSLEHLYVVLVEVWGQTFGLVCERLLGKQEVVIKPLGNLLEDVPCASGATLLGERCALILNVPELVQRGVRGGNRRAPDAAPARPTSAALGTTAPRILLVEDSDTVRESLKRLLQGAGYQVVEARDGAEAFALCESREFDLISTDVMMPNVDGYELTRRLRGGARFRDTPIVMVTSRGEKIDRVRGFDAGVDAYITKPHDRQEYLRVIAQLLKKGDA
jgi:CheY-like chemotaxis protein